MRVEADDVASVLHHGHALALVDRQAHSIALVLARRDLRRAARQQRRLRDERLAVGQLAAGQLHLDIVSEVVDAGPHATRRGVGDHHRLHAVWHHRHPLGDVLAVGRRVVAAVGALQVERGGSHAQRREDLAAHRLFVRGAELALGLEQVSADETGRRRHDVAVLEDLAELRRGSDGAQQRQTLGRRHALGLEDAAPGLAAASPCRRTPGGASAPVWSAPDRRA